MRYLTVFLVMSLVFSSASGQNDFIILRKNNKTIRQFYPGIQIQFFIENRQLIDGYITSIHNDTLYLKRYDIRNLYTGWGSVLYDTITSYNLSFSYKDIIGFPAVKKFDQVAMPAILQIGSAGFIALNIINAGTLHQSLTSKENVQKLGIAAIIFGLGYFWKKANKDYWPIGKKYNLKYIGIGK